MALPKIWTASTKNRLIFAGHEMDEGGRQTSLLPTIDSICRYASDPANGIWIDNVTSIGKYVRDMR